jgi:small subunit ribosomal protein S4e
MSKKGQNRKEKAISAPKAVHIKRKQQYWSVKTRPGAHKRDESVALAIILRDYTGLAGTIKEVKEMLNNGDVKVNGIVRKDYQFSTGLFDTVDLEKQKLHYRVVLDAKGRLQVKEMKKPSSVKIMTPKGIQVTTNDGLTFLNVKAKVGDSLKIKLPERKVEKVLPLQKDAMIYVLKGLHGSEMGKVKEIIPGTAKREKLVKFMKGSQEYETVARNMMVIGEKESELEELRA